MSKKINQVIAESDLVDALRSNLMKRKKQIRARKKTQVHPMAVKINSDDEKVDIIIVDEDVKKSNV